MRYPLLVWFGLAAAIASAKPLQVYILVGQSNMEGHAKVETIDYIGEDPATAPLLKRMLGPDGKPAAAKNVWITYLTGSGDKNGEGFGPLTTGYGSRQDPTKDGGKIGPEFTFGIYMEKALNEPILIIKTAWGGRSIAVEATTSMGAYAASMSAATSVPTATPKPAASTPMSAYSQATPLRVRSGADGADWALLFATALHRPHYRDALHLMHDLRAMGEGNALMDRLRRPTRRAVLARAAMLYSDTYALPDGRIPATFEVICLTGWAPDSSQQKPLRPGSAAQRLADVLKTRELPLPDHKTEG